MEEERVEADTSEHHLLEYALKRRGIVLETAGPMSYLKHEEWRQHLFRSMRQEIVYQDELAPGIPDILKADERILILLERETRKDIQPRNEAKPLEITLDTVLQHAQVQNLLVCSLGRPRPPLQQHVLPQLHLPVARAEPARQRRPPGASRT